MLTTKPRKKNMNKPRTPKESNAKQISAPVEAVSYMQAQRRSNVQEVLERVQQHVAPACSFLIQYLSLFAEDVGLGGMSVYFGDSEIRRYPSEAIPDNMTADEIAELAEQTKMQPSRLRRFCALLRNFPEGNHRCLTCDLKWVARASRTKRTQVYQCHAGLAEIVVPIVVHGKYVGRILTGQLIHQNRLHNGFSEVWERVRDIGNIEKEELEEAYRELGTVTNTELRRSVNILESAARILGELWENMIVLLEQEKQLSQMRVYLEREFAEWLISGVHFSEVEGLARAKSIGLTTLPSVVLLAQPDLTDKSTFEMDAMQKQQIFLYLVEAMHTVGFNVPNSFITSIQPGELLFFWDPPETRNPELHSLKLKELSEKILCEVKRHTKVPILIGFSTVKRTPDQMKACYCEARAAMHNGCKLVQGPSHQNEENGDWHIELHRKLGPYLDELRKALSVDKHDTIGSIFQKMLRIIASCPEKDCDTRRLFFTEMLLCFLDGIQERQGNDAEVEQIRLDYIRSFPKLRTMDDIFDWFRERLAKLVMHIEENRRSPEEIAVIQACTMVQNGLDGQLNRNEIAQALGMSEGHFGNIFRRMTGISFREYVQLARVKKAQSLLLIPGKSVSEVALDVGYADISSFTRAFNKVCGTSPSEYRITPRDYRPVALPALS